MDLYETQITHAMTAQVKKDAAYQKRLAELIARQRKLNKEPSKAKVLRTDAWKKDATR
jgi:hypothetical protein